MGASARGVPALLLNDGGTASYTGGSGTSTLTFAHTATAGQNTADLTVTGSALNGATILDGAGNVRPYVLTARAKGWPDFCRPQGADDFICN